MRRDRYALPRVVPPLPQDRRQTQRSRFCRSRSGVGLDAAALGFVADELIVARDLGVEQAVVVGGGNFFRGNVADDWDRARRSRHIGMLGTVMNGILLRDMLKHGGLEDVRLMTALPMHSMAEPFIRLRALAHLENERMVLLARYRPAVRDHRLPRRPRAIELRADAILLAKHGTDGIYDRDRCPRPARGPRPLARLQRRARARFAGDGPGSDRAGPRLRPAAARVRLRRAGCDLAICQGENRGTYISPATTLVTSVA